MGSFFSITTMVQSHGLYIQVTLFTTPNPNTNCIQHQTQRVWCCIQSDSDIAPPPLPHSYLFMHVHIHMCQWCSGKQLSSPYRGGDAKKVLCPQECKNYFSSCASASFMQSSIIFMFSIHQQET